MHLHTELTTNSPLTPSLALAALPVQLSTEGRFIGLLAGLSSTLTPLSSALYILLPLTLRLSMVELLELSAKLGLGAGAKGGHCPWPQVHPRWGAATGAVGDL